MRSKWGLRSPVGEVPPAPLFIILPFAEMRIARMSIRLKIVLIVVPLIVATLLLTGVTPISPPPAGISRIAKDFLGFKAQELQNQAEASGGSWWPTTLTGQPEMVAATQAAVEGYAHSIILSATELILAVGEDGAGRWPRAPRALLPGRGAGGACRRWQRRGAPTW